MPNSDVNILLVDDRADGLLVLSTVLAQPGYRLVTASSGKEALSLLMEGEYAVILMDVQMPEMNGFETAAYIKARDKTKHIPIIFVTAIDKDERFVSKGYESGAVDYLFKPFDPDILRSKVRVFVDLFRANELVKYQAKQLAHAQQEQQERQLERMEFESLVRYRKLCDSVPHIIWQARSDFRLEFCNQTWTQYSGLDGEQSRGIGWQSVFNPEDLAVFLARWGEVSATCHAFATEARIARRLDDTYRWHLIKGVPQASGATCDWIITCTDIHLQKEAEERLMEAKNMADSANRAKSYFLANMSHEIRTPLTAVLGFTDFLLEKTISRPEQNQYLETIRRNGQQLLGVIDEILDISKIESGSLKLSSEDILVNQLLSEVQASVILQAKKKGLDLHFELDSPIPSRIQSDAVRLRQILINIVGNAVKFSARGTIEVHTAFVAAEGQNPDRIQFTIKDQGPGVDEACRDTLFRPFTQGNNTNRRFGGAGLGLDIARKLARALGGDVQLVETELGQGSTFVASVACGDLKDVPFLEKLEGVWASNRSGAGKSDAGIDLQGVRILLADDSPDNQMLISLLLRKVGAEVDIANNGEEAVRKALNGNHNVVLMDIQMPGVDGYEATQELRERGFKKPIVAVTAHALKEERDRCMEVGCTDYLPKPIEADLLLSRVVRYALGANQAASR